MTTLTEEPQDRRRARAAEAEADSRAAERAVNFSDAVTAIAITLLAIALPVPGGAGDLTNGQVLHAIRAGWPDYFAFLISFAVIGNQWATHRRVLRYAVRLTGWAGRLNMVWLLMMVLTPFAARMLAGPGALGVRFAVYTLIQVIATACLMQMSRELQRGRMLRPDAPDGALRPDSAPYLAVIVTFLVSIPVAFATTWAFALWFAVPLTTLGLRCLMAREAGSVKSVKAEGMADVRDMYLAHTLFRREFARLPELILSIPDGDITGAETVGSHVAMLCLLLHLHHEGEDELVWPKLAARGGAEADAVVATMEKQHHTIEVALARVDQLLPVWRSSGRGGKQIADTFRQLLPALLEHMALEEAVVLPLAERHITASEWKGLVAHSMGAFPKKYLPLVFGLMMEQGDPAVIEDVLDETPLPVRLLMPIIAPRIAIAHNKRLYRAGSFSKTR